MRLAHSDRIAAPPLETDELVMELNDAQDWLRLWSFSILNAIGRDCIRVWVGIPEAFTPEGFNLSSVAPAELEERSRRIRSSLLPVCVEVCFVSCDSAEETTGSEMWNVCA